MILIEYPKCSTCKKAEKYLNNKGCQYTIRDIVKDTPNKEELEKLINQSNKEIRKFFNTSGIKYRELGLKDKLDNMTDSEKLELLASDGMLIKRPILLVDDKVLIGFKEKEWNEIINLN